MLNIITIEEITNPETEKTEKVVTGIKMVGDQVIMADTDYVINDYDTDLVGCNVVKNVVIDAAGKPLLDLSKL